MLEWYDFTVYALFAAYVARNFFPPGEDAAANLLKAFLAFGLGFVVRPLGAVLIGNYGDRAGRKASLTLTILLMAVGTGTIAFAPTYAAIGLGAPLLLLVGRVLQGFSAGGEVGGATAFLAENAPPERRGVVTSWLEASMGMANILGALAAFSVTALLSAEQVLAWGWRVPFLFGLLILPAGLWLRRTLHETDSFQAEAERRRHDGQAVRSPLVEIFAEHKRELPLACARLERRLSTTARSPSLGASRRRFSPDLRIGRGDLCLRRRGTSCWLRWWPRSRFRSYPMSVFASRASSTA
jgi:MHS family proline/betaine transporter-like MFS transporter